jgi:hypothetical protein
MPLHLSAFATEPGRYMRTSHLPSRVSYKNWKSTSHDLLNVQAITNVDAVIIIGLHTVLVLN